MAATLKLDLLNLASKPDPGNRFSMKYIYLLIKLNENLKQNNKRAKVGLGLVLIKTMTIKADSLDTLFFCVWL